MDGFTVVSDAEWANMMDDLRVLDTRVRRLRDERDFLKEEQVYLRAQIDALWKQLSNLIGNAALMNPPKVYVFKPDSLGPLWPDDVLR